MISLRKILTYITLFAFLVANNSYYLYAQDIFVHSLDELPSTEQSIVSESETIESKKIDTGEDIMESLSLSEMIAAKQLYEANQNTYTEAPTTNVDIHSINHDFIQEHELYLAQNILRPTPGMSPSLTPRFIVDPFRGDIRSGSVIEEFILNYESPKTKIEKLEKNGKKYTKKERKVAGTKGAISAKIPEGTIIRTAEGELITEGMLDIVSLETEKKTKAQRKYEKTLKNRGNLKKGRIEVNPEGFDFGIVGRHLIFSRPIAITIDTPHMSEGVAIDLLTMHAGDTDFHTDGLSTDAMTECNPDGSATIPGAQVVVEDGKITFYTCGASSFTINPVGGTTTSNDVRLIVGDYGQVQIYYRGQTQNYGGNPATTGANGTSHYIRLNIGGTSVGKSGIAWTTATTTGSQIGNTYTAKTTMTYGSAPNQYVLIVDWDYTAPNNYLTWRYTLTVPSTNTQNIRLYFGMDSYVAGGDANDVGYYRTTPTQTVGIFDNVANILSAQRYISGATWAGYYAGPYGTVTSTISNNVNYSNSITTTAGDQGYGINWNFGTTPGTYSSTTEWRLTPYIATNVAELSPSIGQPVPNFTVNQPSLIPVIISNAGNIASNGIHTVVFTVATNFTGPTTSSSDNGWSCSAMNIATRQVTCTKTTNIASLGSDTINIPVTPLPAAGGTTANFSASLTNASDSNTTNNTATIGLQVAVAPQIRTLWLRADNGTNCTTSGCAINSWNDQSGRGNNATRPSGSTDTIVYAPNRFNFNPAVAFDLQSTQSRQGLQGTFSGGMTGTGASVFFVANMRDNGSSWPRILSLASNGTTPDWASTTHFNIARQSGTNSIMTMQASASRSSITNALGQNMIASFHYGAGPTSTAYRNGTLQSSTTHTLGTMNINNYWIGANSEYAHYTSMDMAEMMIFNRDIPTTERFQIESYLAIKYGITLDQTTARNYVLSNNGTVWNATAAGVYKNNIAGIARDVIYSLNQVKSQSINNTNDIIIEDVSLPLNDKSALMWAHDNGSISAFSTTDAPSGHQRIGREWLFQEKNSDTGNVKISYPISGLPGGAGSPIYMFVDSDGVFAAGSTTYTGTLVGSNWEWTINIGDMQYITFGQGGDTVAPVISSVNIASGSLIPRGTFNLIYNYSDIGTGINPSTATGRIYSWNTGTLSYNTTPLSGYTTISSNTTSATLNVNNLPHGRYKFDLTIRDNAGNTTTQSYTYFVDAIEWTISADTYNIGNIIQNLATFGTGELTITIRTVGAGFSLTTTPISILARPTGETINYWNGTFGGGYDLWNGSGFGGNILSYSPNATLATVAKNINQNGQKNTFTYRVKYGARVDFMQAAGDYNGSVSFGLNLNY